MPMAEKAFVRKTRYGPLIANRWLQVLCRLGEGSLAFRDRESGRLVIPRAYAAVELADGKAIGTLGGFREVYDVQAVRDAHGEGITLRLSTKPRRGRPAPRLFLTVYDNQPFATLQMEVENTTSEPLSVGAFRVLATPDSGRGRLRLGRGWRDLRFYKHGWQSWSPTLSLSSNDEDLPSPPPIVGYSPSEVRRGQFSSELMGVVIDPQTGGSALAGFITTADQLSQVQFDARNRGLSAVSYADGVVVKPGGSLASERLLVDMTGPPPDSLARYGDALARQMGALSWPHVPGGWCSWYYYWGGVSEGDILENLDWLSEHRAEVPVEYVQIDDGYQADIGDWTTINEKFPHGLGWLAERIHQRGFKAGLWLAPFLVASTSNTFRQHPDWVVRDGEGQPVVACTNWGRESYALDCAHPDAEAWLEELARTMVGEWGFDYLKLDFIYAGAVEGRRRESQATRAQAYRRGLRALRRGAGDAFLLGCGAPLGPSVGLVHGQRIGPDVAPYWRLPGHIQDEVRQSAESVPAVENAMRNTINRAWTHQRLWLNDPDCLLVRDSETGLSLDEVRFVATAIALSGGMLLLSDAMPKLPPERLELAQLLLPPYEGSAVPLDLFERSLPRFFQLAVERSFEQWQLLGVFQWEDSPADVTAPLPDEPVNVYDLWEEHYFGVHKDSLLFLAMPPHSAKLLALRRPVEHPQVLSTTFHFTQGGVELEDVRFEAGRRALTVALRRPAKREGEVVIHVPPSYRERALESDTEGITMTRRADGLLAVRLTLAERGAFTVVFDG